MCNKQYLLASLLHLRVQYTSFGNGVSLGNRDGAEMNLIFNVHLELEPEPKGTTYSGVDIRVG
jgi:hypothetical protein